MRLRRVRAAEADPAEYLAGANAAFGHWGDEALFAWAFRGDAELLFVDDVAGCGVTYRTLSSGECAAIVTGAWTLPEARGRGALTALAEATREIARERGGVALAFMRADNPSARRFAALGARMTPTFYCRSVSAGDAVAFDDVEPEQSRFPSTFIYTPAEWRTQFLERPGAQIECIGRRGEWAAVVERTDDYDRVHAISDERALPLLAEGRRLFWFTMQRPSLPCEWVDGFVAELPASSVSDWVLQNGDRM
jgi:GNAT superfamily N-acetyltransferase